MLTALAILGVLVALFLAGALATREDAALQPVSRDAADLALPPGPLGADDVRGLRFGLALRGYRMDEVDTALARLASELDERDRRIAELSGEPYAGPAGDAPGDPPKGAASALLAGDGTASPSTPASVPEPPARAEPPSERMIPR